MKELNMQVMEFVENYTSKTVFCEYPIQESHSNFSLPTKDTKIFGKTLQMLE
jgi:hypothetical protein